MKKNTVALFFTLVLAFALAGCGQTAETSLYTQTENWAYLETDKSADVDVFFICPTVYFGGEDSYNMPLDDKDAKSDFLGATNMEKGIYDEEARFFAPYYRQVGLNVYELPAEEQETYLSMAYKDVKDAFIYYLEHYNDGRPIILAGFSQGADMSIRLLKDCFADEEVNDLLVACYAIGWRITEEELAEYPHLRFASGEDDTSVIVSFNSEAEAVTDSLMIPGYQSPQLENRRHPRGKRGEPGGLFYRLQRNDHRRTSPAHWGLHRRPAGCAEGDRCDAGGVSCGTEHLC